jgi:phosphatidylinositol-3-phosphatase
MENRSYTDVIGNRSAPFITSLARAGASFTNSYALTHPSQPNYLALFSGSTQGLRDDSCPHAYRGANLGSSVIAAEGTFVGYSESLPRAGFTGCSAGAYARKHAPWVNFPHLKAAANQPFSAFPRSYATLPRLAFVIPNLDHDMHDGTIAQADSWLRRNLAGYLAWARTHNSLLLLTWDEDDRSAANRIPTVLAGARVKPGRYRERVTHYRMLRTLEWCLGLAPIGASAQAKPVTDIWT